MRKIHERSATLAAAYADRALVRALRKGEKGMKEAGEMFLPREPGEQPYRLQDGRMYDPYKVRLERSTLFNATARTVQTLSGKPFSREVTAETTSVRGEKLVQNWLSNTDGKGTGLHDFGKKLFTEGLWSGLAHVLVETPEGGGKPYASIVHPDLILEAEEIDDELVLLRIAETAKRRSPDGLSIESVKRERVYKKDGNTVEWALFEGDEKGNPVQITDWFRHGLSFIPLITYYADPDESSSFFECEPSIQDLANLNLKHWKESSDQSNILHVARVPILFGSGLEDDKQIRIGHDSMITGDDGSDLKFVEHSGQAIGAGRTAIQDIEMQMQSMGLEFMTLKSGSETATGRALNAEGNNSSLASMARSLGNTLSKVLDVMALYVLVTDLSSKVHVHTDYGITMSAEELQALSTARQLGDLSHEDFMHELKRRGVLRAGFDFDANKDRVQAESEAVVSAIR